MPSFSAPEDRSRVHWLVLGAFALGVIVRLALLACTTEMSTQIVDEQHYAALASNIVAGNGFAWGPGQPTSIRPPLYPGLLALVWSVTEVGQLQLVRFLQIVLAAATTWLVYHLGRRAYDDRIGLLAAAIFWLYPSFVFFNLLILTETLFTFLVVAWILLAVTTVQSPRPITALLCGLALGLGALTRSALWPVPLLFCPLMFALVRAPVATRCTVVVAILCGYLVAVLPWAARNTRLQGVVTVVDTMGGMNMRMGNYEHTPEDRMWDAVALTGDKSWSYELTRERPNEHLTEGQKEKWGQRKAIEYMRQNPGQTLRRSLIRFADFWGLEREFIAGVQQGLYRPPTWFAIAATAAILLGYVAVALLGGAGIWLAPAKRAEHLLLLLPVVAIMGVHVLVFGHSRYHLPLVPLLSVYAAALVAKLPGLKLRDHRVGAVTGGATVLILVVVWARQILIADAGRLRSLLDRF